MIEFKDSLKILGWIIDVYYYCKTKVLVPFTKEWFGFLETTNPNSCLSQLFTNLVLGYNLPGLSGTFHNPLGPFPDFFYIFYIKNPKWFEKGNRFIYQIFILRDSCNATACPSFFDSLRLMIIFFWGSLYSVSWSQYTLPYQHSQA